MARIKLEAILDYLQPDLQRALEQTLRAAPADAKADPQRLYSHFKENVRRECRDWARVPDRYVDEG